MRRNLPARPEQDVISTVRAGEIDIVLAIRVWSLLARLSLESSVTAVHQTLPWWTRYPLIKSRADAFLASTCTCSR